MGILCPGVMTNGTSTWIMSDRLKYELAAELDSTTRCKTGIGQHHDPRRGRWCGLLSNGLNGMMAAQGSISPAIKQGTLKSPLFAVMLLVVLLCLILPGVKGIPKAISYEVDAEHYHEHCQPWWNHIQGIPAKMWRGLARFSMLPHDGAGGGTPRPRKLKPASDRMAEATPKVAETNSGEKHWARYA